MLNQVVITGNLGDDPSSHYTPEGLAVSHFNIAFNSSTRKKTANWIKVSCFGKLAEIATTYLHRGARIAVVGVLDQNKWTTDDGQTRSTFQIIANTIEFIKTDGRGFKGGETGEEAMNDEVPF
jgi:single-strand DNA-binding protein